MGAQTQHPKKIRRMKVRRKSGAWNDFEFCPSEGVEVAVSCLNFFGVVGFPLRREVRWVGGLCSLEEAAKDHARTCPTVLQRFLCRAEKF